MNTDGEISKTDILELSFITKFNWFRDIKLDLDELFEENEEFKEMMQRSFEINNLQEATQKVYYGNLNIHIMYYLNEFLIEKSKQGTVIIDNKAYKVQEVWEDLQIRIEILNKVLYYFLIYKPDIRTMRGFEKNKEKEESKPKKKSNVYLDRG